MRWGSMPITCDGPTPRSSGRVRPVATELRKLAAGSVICVLRPEDALAVAKILRQSPEAVFWPEASVREVLQWKGILGLASQASGEVVGFLMGRQVSDEAEVLNLAVAPESRRRGTGGALLRAAVKTEPISG